ncbi:MAG: hypothetical protein FVQ83_13180 [Chloroflexi bacterium]|nr:hypothetical protein [Chloroflexota bacterium]
MHKVSFLIIFIILLTPSFSAGAALHLTPAEIIAAINEYRAENGLYPLETESLLTSAAQGQSDYQASIQSLTHTGPGGSTANGRATAAGYGQSQTIFVEEIIYSGTTATATSAMNWWKASPEHNGIMLSPEYHQIGAGQASGGGSTYFTVVVGRIPGVTSALPLRTESPATEEPTEVEQPTESSEAATAISESAGVQTEATGEEQAASPSETSRETSAGEGLNIPSWVIVLAVVVVLVLLVGGVVLLKKEAETEEDEEELLDDGAEIVATPRSKPELTKPFSELSHAEHFILLEHVAEKALASYDLSIVSVKPLQYRLNASFVVEALPGSDPSYDAQAYLLRVNSPAAHSQDEIRSEMQWLQAIREDTDLKVPQPLENKRGELVTSVGLPNMAKPRYCVALHWQEGKALYEEFSPPKCCSA